METQILQHICESILEGENPSIDKKLIPRVKEQMTRYIQSITEKQKKLDALLSIANSFMEKNDHCEVK